jgi:hypothetical protein
MRRWRWLWCRMWGRRSKRGQLPRQAATLPTRQADARPGNSTHTFYALPGRKLSARTEHPLGPGRNPKRRDSPWVDQPPGV